MSEGSIIRRGKRSWRLKDDLPRDETGVRHTAYVIIKGTRKDAEKEPRARLSAIDIGIHVDPSSLRIGEFVDRWLNDVALQSVGSKALERYRGLVKHQVKQHLGAMELQKLRPANNAAWLQTLGNTGICVRSIRHARGFSAHGR